MTNPNSLATAVTCLQAGHPPEILQIALMVNMSKNLMQHYASANGIDLTPSERILDRCVESYLIEHDIHPRRLQEALRDLQAAGVALVHL